MSRREVEASLAAKGEEAAESIPMDEDAPDYVHPVPQLERNLHSLVELTEEERPAERVIRAKTVVHVVYGFGDASGTGFGSLIQRIAALGRLRQLGPATEAKVSGL